MKRILLSSAPSHRALIILLSLLVCPLLSHAQAPAWQTVLATGSTTVEATATDASGNIFLAGDFTGTVSFGTTTLTSTGGMDIFVAKWNKAANSFAWAQRAGGLGDDAPNDIAISGTSIYIVGVSLSAATFGSTTLTPPNGDINGYLAKLTDAGTSGSFTWAQPITGPAGSGIYTSTVAANGNSVYIAGDASGSTITFGSLPLTLVSLDDAYVAKLTDAGSSGSFVWASRAGASSSAGNDAAFYTRMTVLGNAVYLTGSMSGTAVFGNTTLTSSATNNYDFVAVKLTDAGATPSYNWAVKGSGPGTDYSNRMVVSGSNVYAAGFFSGASFTFGSTVLTNGGTGTDAFLVKMTDAGATGSPAWVQRLGGPGSDNAYGLAVTGSSVYVGGSFSGTASFGTTSLTSAGSSDVFVSKLTDAGSTVSFAWTQQAGGAGADRALALALSGTTLYALGSVTPPATFGSLSIALPAGTTTGFLASLAGNALSTKAARNNPELLSLYPNPAQQNVLVRLSSPTTRLTLTDSQGRLVRTYSLLTGTRETSLDLRGITPGLYQLHAPNATQKLMVE